MEMAKFVVLCGHDPPEECYKRAGCDAGGILHVGTQISSATAK